MCSLPASGVQIHEPAHIELGRLAAPEPARHTRLLIEMTSVQIEAADSSGPLLRYL